LAPDARPPRRWTWLRSLGLRLQGPCCTHRRFLAARQDPAFVFRLRRDGCRNGERSYARTQPAAAHLLRETAPHDFGSASIPRVPGRPPGRGRRSIPVAVLLSL